jgi:hypothetical protein
MIPVFERAKAVHTSDRPATVSAVVLYKSLKCDLRLHLSPDVKLTEALYLNLNEEMIQSYPDNSHETAAAV